MASTITAGNATNGMAITPDGTGILELKTGTGAGTTAISIDASQIVTGTAGNLMLVSGTAVTASGTSIDFTSIPSWVKRITVMFSGVSTDGTSLVQIQLGDSGGFEITGYTSTIYSTTTAPLVGANTSTSGMLAASSVSAATSFTGVMSIVLLNTSNTWVATGTASRSTNSLYSTSISSKSLSDTLTQVRITTVNGTDTFDAGTINIMWE